MIWRRNLRLSVRALGRSRLRTALSVSGMAVGIASVVVLTGAGIGAERALRESLETMGRNLLVVNAARSETGALRGASRTVTTLEIADWEAIARQVPGVLRAAPVVELTVAARAAGRVVSVRAVGTTAEFADVRSFPLSSGRFVDDYDLRERNRVAVVGALVVEQLFRGESPLGQTLFLGGISFRIVGVLEKKGVSPDGANEDEVVILPWTAAMWRLMGTESLSRICIQVASEDAIARVQEDVETLLRRRHELAPAAPADFTIQDQAAMVRAQRQIQKPLSRLVKALSALALGLGGVGLLAVSLLSVRERFSEIGLRLAVGGRPADVLLQFLVEAVLLSLLGGIVGLGLGGLGIAMGSSLTNWPMVLNWRAVLYALAVSVAIAVVFGAYPALRAARLNPIAALNSR